MKRTTLLYAAGLLLFMSACNDQSHDPNAPNLALMSFSGSRRYLEVTNNGKYPITIEKVIINKEFEVKERLVPEGATVQEAPILWKKGRVRQEGPRLLDKWEPTEIVPGEICTPIIDKTMPEPTVVELITNQGSIEFSIKHSSLSRLNQ